jgi:hypothetical protein
MSKEIEKWTGYGLFKTFATRAEAEKATRAAGYELIWPVYIDEAGNRRNGDRILLEDED